MRRDHRAHGTRGEDFKAFRQQNPHSSWNDRRSLVHATAETIREDAGTIAASLFQHRYQPQFGFTRVEQELLEAAVSGMDDTAAAASLFVSLPVIKRRWANIFDHVSAVRPDICPPGNDGKRGAEKRTRILNHIRSHMTEIRPFEHSKEL